ncbi:hypothetical protein DNTS_003642 [Danionella cerebrum]|uniref:RAB36, member RAS oncogene family n=1 Tax=Danionella cerebrum TaxID=2873325 RepID=A0A553NRK7_9TELE|nr:hypothetical protein DNTS_003642 [Danionella translucida]
MQFSPPVSRDRIISSFPQCYNPESCLQLKKDWNPEAKKACQDREVHLHGYDRLKMSKAVVVGDLNVGKTCLINRFCKDVFERDYKATIGVDFEIERQWLSEALQENEPDTCFVFLVGTKRDLLSAEECKRTEMDAIKIAAKMNAEFWAVSSKTDAVLKGLDTGTTNTQIGDGSILNEKLHEDPKHKHNKKTCC